MKLIEKELVEDKLFIKIFGKKILTYNVRKAKIKRFKNRPIFKKRVLVVELNECHFETMPGLCKYLYDLKYEVDILTTTDASDAFSKFKKKPFLIDFSHEDTKDILNDKFLKKYEFVIFNSKVYYHEWKHPEIDVIDLLPNMIGGKKNTLYLQHHIDRINETPIKNQIVLANPAKNPELETQIINAHYFGKKIQITQKTKDFTNFIMVGELSKKRKNYDLLIKVVKSLTENNYKNFKITVVGKGELDNIPDEYKKYFDVKGFMHFSEMYNELEKADYFLTLLDPELEAHQRYMNSGTSGSFQLIYGFLKPCIIHKTFADIYGFTNNNALIYDSNETMYKSMITAIEQTQNQYNELQNNLKTDVIKLEENSILNLKKMIINK